METKQEQQEEISSKDILKDLNAATEVFNSAVETCTKPEEQKQEEPQPCDFYPIGF